MTLPAIRTRAVTELEVPELFSRLRDLVYNLWWSWSPLAHQLFNRLAPATWQHYRNPVDVLIDLGPDRWRQLQGDADFARAYHSLVEQFDAYMSPEQPTWFQTQHPEYRGGPFAYFSTEYGWHECLQTYSGGLGVLAGDHCKSASDLGLPFVGVGLMYKRGYFSQTIDAEGFQQHFYPDYDLNRLPLLPVVDAQNREVHVALRLPGRALHLRVWKATIGRVAVLLLDSDLPINHPADRPITSALYVRGREMRLCQEYVLGLGGVRVLDALGIEPAAWHVNEGHSALLVLQRVRDGVERGGSTLDVALRDVATRTVFTTHTPVSAGNEVFDVALVRKYFADWAATGLDLERLLALGLSDGDAERQSFNLTALALRSSARANGVSLLHGQVANEMWGSLIRTSGLRPIEHVTNGVHLPSWIGPEMGELLRRHLGRDFERQLLEPGFLEAVEAIPDHELWTAHLTQKRRMVAMVREATREQSARHGLSPDELRQLEALLDPDALTIGFARRFATYKRADLILRDTDRLRALVTSADRPVQIIFAGKAHPADRPGQDLIRRIHQATRTPELHNRLVFVESYDMRVGRHLVQGADVWLNTPRRPQEASGTSGIKAAMNGVLNCSILDGWWCEGHDPAHGWAFGGGGPSGDEEAQDRSDAEALYGVLEQEVVPTFYERNEHGLPAKWIRRMKRAMGLLTPRFSTTRMVRDYVERFYLPAYRNEPAPPAAVKTPE
jgi:starch phosphorylase